MYRIPRNHPVRRRLFADDDISEQAKIDNFANVLQETTTRDKIEKMHKWNFDFENDRPLNDVNGAYEWSVSEGPYDWVGRMGIFKHINEKTDSDVEENDSFLMMKALNEETPKSNKDDCAQRPFLRKRRKEGDCSLNVGGKEVKRRISFD